MQNHVLMNQHHSLASVVHSTCRVSGHRLLHHRPKQLSGGSVYLRLVSPCEGFCHPCGKDPTGATTQDNLATYNMHYLCTPRLRGKEYKLVILGECQEELASLYRRQGKSVGLLYGFLLRRLGWSWKKFLLHSLHSRCICR